MADEDHPGRRPMNVWEFIDRRFNALPGWPTERQWVMFMTIGTTLLLLRMARENGTLWNVELFKTILTVFCVTGFINMIVGFWYSANKSSDTFAETINRQAEALNNATGDGGADK